MPPSGSQCRPAHGKEIEKHMIEVTLTIDFGPAERQPFEAVVTVPEKSTILDVLFDRVPIVTSAKYGMDHFVEAIDGVKNDFAGDRGWRFEVNGRRSNVPAERYLVKNGDWIKWIYLAGSCS
jgi:Domain of unknown function (DUF4430)